MSLGHRIAHWLRRNTVTVIICETDTCQWVIAECQECALVYKGTCLPHGDECQDLKAAMMLEGLR